MKPKTLIPIFFLLFLSCQYISELKHKDEIVSEAYVNNPNGLALYKTKGDLKSKEVVLKPEEKFYFLEKSNDDVKESWRKVLYGGKELFAYSSYYRSEILEYRNLEKDESRFAVLEYEVQLKDNPRNDSNDLELLPAYSVVEIIGITGEYGGFSEMKVKTQNHKIGFIYSSFSEYSSQSVAEKNSRAEFSRKEGFFLVTASNPVFLDKKSMLPIYKSKYKAVIKNGDLIYVNYSKRIEDIRYYSFESTQMWNNSEESSFLIPESNGIYMNEKEFTEYTIKNTKYSGDRRIMYQIMNEENTESSQSDLYNSHHWFNFLEFTFTKLVSNYKKEDYYLAAVDEARMHSKKVYYIFRFNKGQYIKSALDIEFFGIHKARTLDIDGDGILEILIGMKNGKYQSIAYFLRNTVIKDGIFLVGHTFHERINIDSHAYKSHPKGTKLKYKKGKLIKIK